MPRLRQDLVDCVVYLYGCNPQTGALEGPKGTGSLLRYQGEDNRPHYYAVSNWHLANKGASVIRINLKNGGSRFLAYDPADWHFIPGGHDVTVADVTDELTNEDRFYGIPTDLFVTEWVRFKYELAGGDDVLMIGMFADHYGKDVNIPAVRFGSLSLLANKDNPIEQENNTDQPSHIADMRSRAGFSGSPVFVFRLHTADLSKRSQWNRDLAREDNFQFPTSLGPNAPDDHFVGFLGVHCGQFWERVNFRKPRKKGEKIGDPILEGDEIEVQSGMTVIVPAWRVSETLELEVFETTRRMREAQRSKGRPRAESTSDEMADSATPETDNPAREENLISLLNAAVTKSKPDA